MTPKLLPSLTHSSWWYAYQALLSVAPSFQDLHHSLKQVGILSINLALLSPLELCLLVSTILLSILDGDCMGHRWLTPGILDLMHLVRLDRLRIKGHIVRLLFAKVLFSEVLLEHLLLLHHVESPPLVLILIGLPVSQR